MSEQSKPDLFSEIVDLELRKLEGRNANSEGKSARNAPFHVAAIATPKDTDKQVLYLKLVSTDL